MAVYVIVDVAVDDPERYAEYRATPSTAGEFGGRFIVRGGERELLECGDWQPNRVAVMEFPDAESARAWYGSEDYQRKARIRHASARSTLLLIEGVTDPGPDGPRIDGRVGGAGNAQPTSTTNQEEKR
jgi:uncharacterized protein (DUF1330 family)